MRLLSIFLSPILLLLPSCADGLSSGGASWTLSEESGEDLENVPAVARFRLSGARGFHIEDVWLVSGDVSSVSQGKLAVGEVPQTVEEKRQPLVAWLEGEDAVLAPTSVLEAGATYSLVALGVGLLGTFTVSEEERPLLRLLGESRFGELGEIFYCIDGPPPADLDLKSALDGVLGLAAGVSEQGAGQNSCVRMQMAEGQEFFLPPSSVGEILFEPTPIRFSEQGPTLPDGQPPNTCSGVEGREFWGGCLEVAAGAALVHLSPGYFALSLRDAREDPVHERVIHVKAEESHALGPLESDSNYRLEVTPFFPGASPPGRVENAVEFQSGGAAPRFVLTELLADPFGSEPEGEWIEVANVGTGTGSLGGLEIWDSSGAAVLPDVALAPGDVGLIVRLDFSFESDEIPDPAGIPVPVATLGGNGLRNSGEEVLLRSPDGRVISRIVPVATRAGESVARTDPWAPDIGESFVAQSPPTPGKL